MKIVSIEGEMPEQMFQYALYCRLRSMGGEVALDAPRNWIGSAFHLDDAVMASQQQIADLLGSVGSRLKVLLKISKTDDKVISDTFGHYHRDALEVDEGYFRGSWASQRYFEPVADVVAKAFVAPVENLSPASAAIVAEMQNSGVETVALHVHRPTSAQNTCTTDYYNWAIANIRTYIPDARFFVFSTDVDLASQCLLLPEGSRVIDTKKISDFDLLQTMLHASHNIGANTLLSWWAAWLNPNPDKITIVPNRWTPAGTPPDLIPIYWTAIPTT